VFTRPLCDGERLEGWDSWAFRVDAWFPGICRQKVGRPNDIRWLSQVANPPPADRL